MSLKTAALEEIVAAFDDGYMMIGQSLYLHNNLITSNSPTVNLILLHPLDISLILLISRKHRIEKIKR